MVFQHFSLFETLTVAENISLAQDAARPVAGLSARVREISRRYGLPLDPQRPVHTLSVAERQRVEIIRSLLQAPALLIMDEPTSVLTPQAVTNLFATLRTLAAEGCSILYISHKLDEIRELCDRATVLRGGRVTGECDPRAETAASLARMMIGGDVPHPHHRKSRAQGAARLEVDRLSLPPDDPFGAALAEVTFSVHAGEVLGIAGISGNGQRELVAALSGERALGADVPERAIAIDGTPAARLTARARRALGLAFVPEERFPRGAVPEMSLAENTLLTAHRQHLVRAGFVRERALAAFTAATIDRFGVKAAGPRRGGAVAVGRQPAEVHRRPRDPPASEHLHRGAADLGPRRRGGGRGPPGADRPARRGRRGSRRVRRSRRALRDLRQHRRHREWPAVGEARRARYRCRGDRAPDGRIAEPAQRARAGAESGRAGVTRLANPARARTHDCDKTRGACRSRHGSPPTRRPSLPRPRR